VRAAGIWLRGVPRQVEHICWDGCMFPNATMHEPETWRSILQTMLAVRAEHGWNGAQ
jgi:hypothetical protein